MCSCVSYMYVCAWRTLLSWLSWELSPQMGVQLFLNEFNYRDGTIHQNIARRRAPNSSVVTEKQFGASLLLLCVFTQSHTEPEAVKDLCLGTGGRQELGALWRRIQLGCGAKRLDGSTAKTNFFILYAVLIWFSALSLCRTQHWAEKGFLVSHGGIFWEEANVVYSDKGQFHVVCLFFVSAAVVAVA